MKERFLLFNLLILSGFMSVAQTGNNENLIGKVFTSDSQAAALATVHLKETSKTVMTNRDGVFVFKNIRPGTYTIQIAFVGHESVERMVHTSDSTTAIAIQLPAAGKELTEVIVSAGRTRESIDEIPSSVTVIGTKALEQAVNLTTNLGNILENKVPGLAPSTGLSSNFGQTLRGRSLLIMVDGVPQSTPLRNGSMDLRALDPAVIERVEVVKGATAIYGNGAAGGLVNYFTRNAKTTKLLNSQTSVGTSGSLVRPANSMGGRLGQLFYGDKGKFNYAISGVYEQTGEQKDAKGDVLPPVYGLGETDSYNAFAKLGYEFNANHSVQVSYNFFRSLQTTNYLTVNGDYKNGVKASAKPGENKGVPQGVRGNHNLNIQLTGLAPFARTRYDVDLYYQKVDNVFFYSESFVDGGISRILSRKNGARIVLNTPLDKIKANLTYGLDAQRDITSQPLVDGRIWVPEMNMFNLAPFLQAKVNLLKDLVLKGGIRYEKVNIAVADYVTLPTRNTVTGAVTPSMNVKGGKLDYNAWVTNIGLRYHVSEYFSPYISYSQGFSVSDIGLVLRAARVNDIAKINTEAVIVNNYEIGFVSKFNNIRFEATGYISKSSLGANSVYNNGIYEVVRTPERIYGYELSADARVTKNVYTGLSYSYVEGKIDGDNDGRYDGKADDYLGGQRIAAPKMTGYIDYKLIPGRLNILLQYTGVMKRDRFARNNSGSYDPNKAPVNPYHLVNVLIGYTLDQSTTLSLGMENLFNQDYFTARSQWEARDDTYNKGKGASYRVTMNIKL